MRNTFIFVGLLQLAAMAAAAQERSSAGGSQQQQHHHHAETVSTPATAPDPARQRLEKSPRHQEWVMVKNGNRIVHSYLVYPEVKNKALAVLVIHENRGLTDWVRSVADQLAEAGYIAIAPDMLSGMAPGGGGGSRTSDFADSTAIGQAFAKLPPEQLTGDLNAVADHVRKLPAANGKIAVAGFCWGGRQAFQFAAARPDLAATFVFYGTGPESRETIAKIKSPVYGFYGGNDARVNATIPQSTAWMKETGKTYEPVIYEDAGHGFMRAGEEANASEANKKARAAAWGRWLALLKKL